MTPRNRRNFNLSIETSNERLVDCYSVIEQQLVSFDIGTENLLNVQATHINNSVVLWLLDDEAGNLMKSIRNIQSLLDRCNMHLDIHDANGKTTERYSFIDCQLAALQHSTFTYESASDDVFLKSPSGEEWRGALRSQSNRDHSLKLLKIAITHFNHEFIE